MSRDGFVERFSSEAYEIAKYLGVEDTEVALDSLFHLHRRHSESVLKVMAHKIAEHSLPLVKATLPDKCLIRMVGAGLHLVDGKKIEQPEEGQERGKTERKSKLTKIETVA